MRKRITYANVAATLALVFAMSGGAWAASHYLINSTRQINPKVLKKLKGNTGKPGRTGATGKEGTAGKEGPQGLQGKEGPQGKEGVSGMIRWRTTVAAAGKSKAEPATVVLAKVGPFTVTGNCYVETTLTDAATYISTSETGSYAQGYSGKGSEKPLTAGESLQISEETAEGTTATHETDYLSPNDGSWSAMTHEGSVAFDGFGTQGVWLQGASGPACSFSGYLVIE
jgi:collagen triple helix repeat protein